MSLELEKSKKELEDAIRNEDFDIKKYSIFQLK